MANWTNPLITSTYTNFVTEVKDRDIDAAVWFSPASGRTFTNLPAFANRFNESNNSFERWNGTTWGALSTILSNAQLVGTTSVSSPFLIPTVSGTVPANGIFSPSTNIVGFSSASTARMWLDATGRLLINTANGTSPIGSATSRLQVRATGDDAVIVGGDSFVGLNIVGCRASSSDHAILSLSGARGTIAAPGALVSGDLVGTIRSLVYNGSSYAVGTQILSILEGTPSGSIVPTRLSFQTCNTAGSLVEAFQITANGNFRYGQTTTNTPGLGNTTVGLGMEPSNGALFLSRGNGGDVLSINNNGTSNAPVTFRSSSTVVGSISTTGSSTSYNTSSDYRLKTGVVALDNAIDRVKTLNPIRFKFFSNLAQTLDGFLAHEVQDIVPEAVKGEKDAVDGENNPIYQGIDQAKLVPLLTAALQESIALIEDLQARVAILEAG